VRANVVEWGGSTAVRQCGTLLGSAGTRVTRYVTGDLPDPNGVADSHLDRFKTVLPEPDDPASVLTGIDLLVTDGSFPVPLDEVLGRGVDVVTITPFGLTGIDAGTPGGDLIASHAGGYAHYVTWSVDDPSVSPPTRGPEGQAQLVAGLTGAVAAASRLVSRLRGGSPELTDVSEQEAVATLLLPQLSEHTEGTLKTGRHRVSGGSKVAGGLVGLLRCADGYAIVSPREDHQWARMMSILGDPPWGSDAGAATAAIRMANWEILQEKLSAWSSGYPKEKVFREFQAARIPCFPVNRVRDALGLDQLALRKFFYTGQDGTQGPGVPFRFRATA
jgi:crotonobetainyl-CoA:carnitine CoA-transferase CaiB-like acyl-CoA transferase